MSISIGFRVHGKTRSKVRTEALVEGKKMFVDVDCLEVELDTSDPRSGALTLRFVGEQIDEADRAFVQDQVVWWSPSVPPKKAAA